MNSNVDPFNRDVVSNLGYLYTTNAKLSSLLANRRLTDTALALADFRGRRVVDIGCGDGTYTQELFIRGQCASIHGIDPAGEAIIIAQQKVNSGNITFAVNDACKLPYEKDSFDVAYIRGVLHHMERPFDALKEALRVAPMIVVIEPNGYNLGLKIIEKVSPYHREHREKSYTSRRLQRWIEAAGGRVVYKKFAGFVPMFCPDWLAKTMKAIEPVIERLPLINSFACAVVVLTAERVDSR